MSISCQASCEVARSAEQTFDFIGTHCYQNHPKWESEVLAVEPLQDGHLH